MYILYTWRHIFFSIEVKLILPTYEISTVSSQRYNQHSRKIVIAESTSLYRNVQEYGFPFQFTCNNDLRVYYNGYFLKQIVMYSNEYNQQLNGLQIYYNVDVMDCAKLTRDFKNITSNDIQSIIDQLLPLCISQNNKGELNKQSIIFNVSCMEE